MNHHVRIHYRPDTGRIVAFDNCDVGPGLNGASLLTIELPEGYEAKIDMNAQRVNLETLELEDMSDAEIQILKGPQDWEVKQAIAFQLIATDGMMAPDRNVPDREAWAAYRQALRDLSKGDPRPTPMQMVAAFPLRPDGTDAVPHLRAKTQG